MTSTRCCQWNDYVRCRPEIHQELHETSRHEHRQMSPPISCLTIRRRTDCNPTSMNSLVDTPQGCVGHCLMQGPSIAGRAARLHPIKTNQCRYMVSNRQVRTLYFLASAVRLTTELIFDMASMAMMPLMARLVWLLTDKPSAESLVYHPLSVVGSLSPGGRTYWSWMNNVEFVK